MFILGTEQESIFLNKKITMEQYDLIKSIIFRLNCCLMNDDDDCKLSPELCFPAFDRPTSSCRWYIDSSRDRIYYDLNLDDYMFSNRDTYFQMIDWLQYIIKYIFNPLEIILNGRLIFYTTDDNIYGKIIIRENKLNVSIFRKVPNFFSPTSFDCH